MSNRYKIDKDMLGVLQRHKQVCTKQSCTTCNEYIAMINPQQNTVDKVIQKAVDVGLLEKTQDYLKQGYKIDNLSNGSIGVYLGNDEDTQELEYKTQKGKQCTIGEYTDDR